MVQSMKNSPHFLFLFLDGVGIGTDDPSINPFFSATLPNFINVFGGIPCKGLPIIQTDSAFVEPCDALLGVEGFPQSGTGQVTLFTGVNAAQLIAAHFGPYPHSRIRPVLEEKNIFKTLKELGADVHFANAFPKQFFEYIKSGKRKLSATTMSCIMSGVPICDEGSLRSRDAISADITGERWKSDLGYSDLEPVSAFDSGRILRKIVEKRDFTMFEFFLTDKAGHDQDMEFAMKILKMLDEFLEGIAEGGLDNITILISSDHGNVEDLSVKTHTFNPALTAVAGRHAKAFSGKLKSIMDVTPAVIELFRSLSASQTPSRPRTL